MERLRGILVGLAAWAAILPISAQAQVGLKGPVLNGQLQPPSASEPARESSAEERARQKEKTTARREHVAQRLTASRKALEQARAAQEPDAAAGETLAREVDLLTQLELSLKQLVGAQQQQAELDQDHDLWQMRLESPDVLASIEGEPSSFLVQDRLRDELATEEARSETLAAATQAATQAVQHAREVESEKQRAKLRAKELLERNKEGGSAAQLSSDLRLAELEAELASVIVELRQAELANQKLIENTHALQLQVRRRQLELASQDVVFLRRDLEERLAELAKTDKDLRQKIEFSELDMVSLNSRYFYTRHDSDASAKVEPQVTAELRSLETARQARQHELEILHKRLDHLAKMRTAWNRRFDVINSRATSEELLKWESETQQVLELLHGERRQLSLRVEDLRNQLADVERELQVQEDASAEVRRQLTLQRGHLEELGRIYDSCFISIESTRRLYEKLLAEIRQDVESASLGERLALAGQQLVNVWNYPLLAVDEHPITIGKVVSGLVLLVLGYLLSSYVSRLVGTRMLPRLGLHTSAAGAIQSLAFYLLVASFTFVALRLVNVPLTVFTFLGGAVAIGVGFGSQNIVNNFISGLILLAERPIRTGDLIELDGLYGTVTKIGARSTRVTTANNLEIIVPNSSFLENNVINWTLSDDKIRAGVRIGVAYGSPTRDVSRLLKRAADEHGLIMEYPEPFVWFADFGENALVFELHFWISMRSLSELRRIESDVRHKVDSLFREAGIVVAFPQRDVHLHVGQPIDVRVARVKHDQESLRRSAA